MNREDGDFRHEARPAHYVATGNPAKQEAARELSARLDIAEACVDEEITSGKEAPPAMSDKEVRKAASLTEGEWGHIQRIALFKDRYFLGNAVWSCWTAPVINQCRSFILKDYKSAGDLRREAAERERIKAEKAATWAATRQAAICRRDGKPFEKSPVERAAIGERMKATWARRRAQGGKQSQ